MSFVTHSLIKSLLAAVLFVSWGAVSLSAADRPNILWITSEDNGPELGCYGDTYATTPHLDQLAEQGLRYLHCWSNAPVCAPARTTIISGLYPTSLGAEHMRSMVPMPAGMHMFPYYLRKAGYYCTNNNKEDYNLEKGEGVWDVSSKKAHWKNRAAGQPFFAVFNHTVSHESQIRTRPHKAIHDPAQAPIPAYHPDTPETRQDWAQYYDKVTEMDALVGKNIAELKEAGLWDETIIVYFGDHGSGMPRHKRWPYNSGLHVPLLVRIPAKFQHLAPPEYQTGGTSDRLVSFVDLAPTMLSLCGLEIPEEMPGRAFAGKKRAEGAEYLFGYRGRMDERLDMVRSVRDERFVYVRQFQPQRPYGQYLEYMFQTPTTQKWYEMHLAGELNPVQDRFWQEKPTEELYDLQADPEEIHNLAEDPQHAETLKTLRQALVQWMQTTQDLGIVPEPELRGRAGERSPYDCQRAGELLTDYDLVLRAAFVATARHRQHNVPTLNEKQRDWLFQAEEPAIRYWGCQWALREKEKGIKLAHDQLRTCLNDTSSSVRVAAAEALGRYGNAADLEAALQVLLKEADLTQSDVFTAVAALNVLDDLDQKAASIQAEIADLPETTDDIQGRMKTYVPRILEKTLADLNVAE